VGEFLKIFSFRKFAFLSNKIFLTFGSIVKENIGLIFFFEK